MQKPSPFEGFDVLDVFAIGVMVALIMTLVINVVSEHQYNKNFSVKDVPVQVSSPQKTVSHFGGD